MKVQTVPVTETNKVIVVSVIGSGAMQAPTDTTENTGASNASEYSVFSNPCTGNLPALDIGAMNAALFAAITIIFDYFHFGPKSDPEEISVPEDTEKVAVTGSNMESFLSHPLLTPLNVMTTIVTVVGALTVCYSNKIKAFFSRTPEPTLPTHADAKDAQGDSQRSSLTEPTLADCLMLKNLFKKYNEAKGEYVKFRADHAHVPKHQVNYEAEVKVTDKYLTQRKLYRDQEQRMKINGKLPQIFNGEVRYEY